MPGRDSGQIYILPQVQQNMAKYVFVIHTDRSDITGRAKGYLDALTDSRCILDVKEFMAADREKLTCHFHDAKDVF